MFELNISQTVLVKIFPCYVLRKTKKQNHLFFVIMLQKCFIFLSMSCNIVTFKKKLSPKDVLKLGLAPEYFYT